MAADDKTKRDVDPDTNPNIDQGYAWVILAGCFVSYMLVIGTVKSYGILYTEIVTSYSSGTGSAAWIGSTVLLGTLGLSPIANMLGKKFTFRAVALLGGILLTTGYFLSGFVQSIAMLFLTLGLCAGIGYGFSFAPCSTIISYYFKKHRALANGIVVSASGVGAICFPFVYKYLIHEFGLKGAFWIVGAVLGHTCISACLFRQPRLLVEARRREKLELEYDVKDNLGEEKSPKNKMSCFSVLDNELKFSLFKMPRFTIYVIVIVFAMNGFGNNLILIPSQIKALGYGKFQVALGVTVMGAFEVTSRIVFGWFADLKLVRTKNIFLVNMIVSTIISFIAPFFTSFEMMAVYAGMIGTFPGSVWSQLPILVIEVVGMEYFPPAFGLVMLSVALGCVVSQPIIGWLQDITGNWNAAFYLTGCLFLCSSVILALENQLTSLCMNKKEMEDKRSVQSENNEELLPLQTSPLASDEVDSSLTNDKFQDNFTSPRVNRIYRPYDALRTAIHVSSPSSNVPIVDTAEV